MHFLNLFLPCLPLIRCLTTPNPPMLCDDVLKAESKEMWSNIASLSSIFYHVFKTGCLVCSKQKCNDSRKLCSRQSEVMIPMYNNLFEFGLSGKYFPESGSIRINYKANNTCYLKINLIRKPERKIFGFDFYQCYSHSFGTETICQSKSKRMEFLMDFSNEYCLYFGLAFYDADKVHLTSSPYCNKFASDKFDYNSYYTLKKRSCYFNKTVDKPEAIFELFQSEKRNFDGVPIILPCSPGGFVVDPKTGRFVINETCFKMFSDSKEQNVGINFLIKKMYNGNENLLFPRGDYRTKDNLKPIYISKDGKAKSRESMASIVKANKEKGNKIRVICEYHNIGDLPYISATVKPLTPSNKNKNGTTVALPKAVTRNPRGAGSQPCSKILKDLKPTRTDEGGEGHINSYVHGESACFLCAEPSCNYKLKSCPLKAELELQVYNNIFEFGLSGKYMPESSDIRIHLNKNCYLKIEIFVRVGNVSFYLQECRSTGDKKNDDCAEIRVHGFEEKVLFNNWYCPQIALALHVDNKIFYGFSFRCDKFASSQLNETIFQWLKFEECYTNRNAKNVKVKFIFNQGDLYTIEGVPIMLPCSSGGYAVDSKNGRFAINQTCDDMFWETIVNSSKSSGIHFIIKEIYQSNENFLFKSRKDAETKYPTPIYMNLNGGYESFQEMLPTIKNNTEKFRKLREKCLYKRSLDSHKFKKKKKVNISGIGQGGSASKATKAQLSLSELILIFLTLIKCQ